MPIVLDCDCGKKLKARDDLAGKWVNCPACGRGLLVPLPENQAQSTGEVALKGAAAPPAPQASVPAALEYQQRWRVPKYTTNQRPLPAITAPEPRLRSAESSWRGFVHYLL